MEQSNTDLHYDKAFQPHYFKQVKMLPGIILAQVCSKEHKSGFCQNFSRNIVVFPAEKTIELSSSRQFLSSLTAVKQVESQVT